MKMLVASISLLFCSVALSQGSQRNRPVAARQTEVNQIAQTLYDTNLESSDWTSKDLPLCASFKYHRFSRFEHVPQNQAADSFVAIHQAGHPPAPNVEKPWEGGTTLLRLRPQPFDKDHLMPGDKALIVAFNRAIEEERVTRHTNDPSLSLSNAAAALCFIQASGNVPDTSFFNGQDPADYAAKAGKISGILVPLVSQDRSTRSQYVNFDKNGLITEAGVSLQRNTR